ncbi:MAG: HAMP domain-containing sensor histidine kinase [Bacteroidota bacterium]
MPDAPSSHSTGFAIACDTQGAIVEVLRDDLRIPDTFGGIAPFGHETPLLHSAVELDSASKARNLLDYVRSNSVGFDWELHFPYDGQPTLLYVNAVKVGTGFLLTGAPNNLASTRLLGTALVSTANGLGRLLRAIVRDRLHLLGDDEDLAEPTLYDEFSKLQSELSRMQRQLVKQKVELENLDEQKNYFIGMAAHELRNPLCSIRFYSDYLSNHDAALDPEKHARFLKIIYESSGFMARLVDDLLSLSRIETGHLDLDLALTDLNKTVAHAADLYRLVADSKRIDFSLELTPIPLHATVDENKIDQVLGNLISNAIKYSDEGTTVHVRTFLKEPYYVAIQVIDEGPGIPEDELNQLFEPFHTTSVKSTAGERSTGLGLYITLLIVEGHQGTLSVESVLDQGTTFTVTLPINAAAQAAAAQAQDTAIGLPLS